MAVGCAVRLLACALAFGLMFWQASDSPCRLEFKRGWSVWSWLAAAAASSHSPMLAVELQAGLATLAGPGVQDNLQIGPLHVPLSLFVFQSRVYIGL